MRKTAKRAMAIKEVMTIRIAPDLKRQMLEAAATGPYRISTTAIVERGIELAIKEIEEMRKSK